LEIPREENKQTKVSSTSKINIPTQNLLFNEKEMFEEFGRKEQVHELALDLKDQNFKSRPSVLTSRKHIKVIGEENQHKNHTLNPKDRTFKLKIKTFNSKSIPQDGDQIKKLTFVHSDKYWRLYTNSLISIQILFVHIFCDYTIGK